MSEGAPGEPTKLTPAQRLAKGVYGVGREFGLGPATTLALTKYSLYALRMREIRRDFADPDRATASYGPIQPSLPGVEEEVMVLTRDAFPAQLDLLTELSDSLKERIFTKGDMQEAAEIALKIVADMEIA